MRVRIPACFAVAASCVFLSVSPVFSQAADPPYETQLQRLAEILGALHYLRPLCGAPEGPAWRDQMDAMLTAEAPSPDRRARLVSQFNHGFSSFASVYRVCTPAATAAVERYLREGEKLSRDITTRYGR